MVDVVTCSADWRVLPSSKWFKGMFDEKAGSSYLSSAKVT